MADRPSDDVLAVLAAERGRALVGYAFLLTGDVAAAEDLVQEALLKVFVRARGGFSPDTAEAYVRRAVLTLYVDGYRRRRHWASLRHLLWRDDVGEAPDGSVADRLDLRSALAGLAPRERASVVLRFYEDLTVPETADRLGVSAGSVKRYLSNAMVKLEARLGPLPDLHDPAHREALAVERTTERAGGRP